jgi:hypothetical protein
MSDYIKPNVSKPLGAWNQRRDISPDFQLQQIVIKHYFNLLQGCSDG